jgi:PP-loop superfamily ATP-utilizing enzyme
LVEAGEALVRGLGFRVLRVRHLVGGDGKPRARVQVAREEMDRLPPLQAKLEAGLLAVGYAAVEIDPEGYRTTEMPSRR